MEKENKIEKKILLINRSGKISREEVEIFIKKMESEGATVIVQEADDEYFEHGELKEGIKLSDIKEFDEIITPEKLHSYTSSKTYEESFPTKPKPVLRPEEHKRIFRKQNR